MKNEKCKKVKKKLRTRLIGLKEFSCRERKLTVEAFLVLLMRYEFTKLRLSET